MSHRVKLSIIAASALALAVFVLSLGFVWGAADQSYAQDRAAAKLHLPDPSAENNAATAILTQANQLADKKQFDQAIAVLTPLATKTTEPKDMRILAMQSVARNQQSKGDLAASITWYQKSEALNGAPLRDSTLAIASTAARLYWQQPGNPATSAIAQQNKQLAIASYTKGLTLITDATLLDQTKQQLTAITKAP